MARTKRYVGIHRRLETVVTSPQQDKLNTEFANGSPEAIQRMDNLLKTTEAHNPLDMLPGHPESRQPDYRVRRAAAAALLAVGVVNPGSADVSVSYLAVQTVAVGAANTHNAVPLNFDALVADMAQHHADHPAATDHSQQPHDNQTLHPYG